MSIEINEQQTGDYSMVMIYVIVVNLHHGIEDGSEIHLNNSEF